ncbi:hypothetical protein N431DRAFT_338644 [Stipitochalara longipes BDJ]|nr:hypothetical protein N431DRAFT_338644 [Stipitochalara longipes BDJ]
MAHEVPESFTMDQLLALEAKHGYIPDFINLQKWKEVDATSEPPYWEEEPDGSLQFYNCDTGRPCRKLCDFEKAFLEDFYRYLKPGFPIPSFKSLECWRQQLNTSCLDIWENYVKLRQTQAQKEERDESIRDWLRMMHDAFWHKEQHCACKHHSREGRLREPTLATMIESVKEGRPKRDSAKNNDAPRTPSKVIKTETVDTASAKKGKGKKKDQQEDEDGSDFEAPKTAARKVRKKRAAANDTSAETGKTSAKADTLDTCSANKAATKKRKTPAKVAGTRDTGATDTPPTKKGKSAPQVVDAPDASVATEETPIKKSSNINLAAKHPEVIEALVAGTVKNMYDEATTLNKTPKEVIEGWTGLTVNDANFPVRKSTTPARKQTPNHIAKKKTTTPHKKVTKAKKANNNDGMLVASPDVSRNALANNPPHEPFGELLYDLPYEHAYERQSSSRYELVNDTREDPFGTPSDKYTYGLAGLSLAQRYELEMSMLAAQDIRPNSPIPQTPLPKLHKMGDENVAMSGMTPTQEGTGAEITPSRMLHFDGLTLGEQEYKVEDQEMKLSVPHNTPSTLAKRKSPVENADDDTPTKKSKASATKNGDDTTTNETATDMMGAREEIVEVEKSSSIIMF